MKKILIATGIYPPDIGGPATILKALSKSLGQAGFDIKVITYTDAQNSHKTEPGVYRIAKNRFYSRWHYLLKMFFLAYRADLLYVTDTYSVGYFAYLISKYLKKKYIIRFAGDSAWEAATSQGLTTDYVVDFQINQHDQKVEKLKTRRQLILLGASRVIAVSNFMAHLAKQIGVAEKNIKVIYNSVDFIGEEVIDENIVKQIKQKYAGQGKIIMTAGRLVPWKGLGALLKILPDINQQIGACKLLILGSGPERKNLEQQAIDLKISQQVEFLGVIDHHQIIDYIKAADVFVLNTYYEGLSHTLLEAMRAEVPIVTTKVGGNPEMLQNNQSAYLVDYNDEIALKQAIIKLLTDANLAQSFTLAAKQELNRFNWQTTISETVKLIREI